MWELELYKQTRRNYPHTQNKKDCKGVISDGKQFP
jgi:hypothetical protein